MDWARNYLGQDVQASDCDSRFGLSCPTCNEPVNLRSGNIRRPYFAHQNHSAKPECENYRPGYTNNSTLYTNQNWPLSNSTPYKHLISGGVFLKVNENGAYSLIFKLPRLSVEDEIKGKLKIQTDRGEREYDASQLFQFKLFPVDPTIPLIEVTGSESLNGIISEIEAYVDQYKRTGNFFKIGDSGSGKLLSLEEPLQWEGSYWLLSQEQLNSIPIISGLIVEKLSCWPEWYLYQITLPLFPDSEDELDTIRQLFQREIKKSHFHAYFITPPHHFEQDGTSVFSEDTQSITIKTTGYGQISIPECQKAIICDLGNGWFNVTGLHRGIFSVLLDGSPKLIGQLSVCKLFQPKGIQIDFNGVMGEVFETDLIATQQINMLEHLFIKCPSSRVADFLDLDQNVWYRDNCHFALLDAKSDYSVIAKNFGTLFFSSTCKSLSQSTNCDFDEITKIRILWLEGVIARIYGADVLNKFRTEISSLSLKNPQLIINKLICLYPHIQLIKGQFDGISRY